MSAGSDAFSSVSLSGGDWRVRLEQAIDAMLEPIRQAPKRPGGETLYSMPWFLFCGDGPAGMRGLLDSLADSGAVAVRPARSGEALWDWAFFGDAVGVAASPAVVTERHSDSAAIWSSMIDLLRRKRPLTPLNGVVAGVAAGALTQSSIRETARQLRVRIDGAMSGLGLTLPVYLVVTGMEALPGFGQFVGALPPACREQVMGARFPEAALSGAEAGAAFEQAFDDITARTDDLMLAVMRDGSVATAQAVFRFAHALRCLREGFVGLTRELTADSALQRRPVWRGVYFVGAAPEAAFVADLARRFLPVDQPIARRAPA